MTRSRSRSRLADRRHRIINKLEDIGDFPNHFLDQLKNHPGYKLRVSDFRVLVDWDKDNEMLYAINAFELKKEYRELGKYRELGGRGGTTRRGDTTWLRKKTIVGIFTRVVSPIDSGAN